MTFDTLVVIILFGPMAVLWLLVIAMICAAAWRDLQRIWRGHY